MKFASDRKVIMSLKPCKRSAKVPSSVETKKTEITSSVWLEIRAGVGGAEACSFASQLLRMYERFSTKMSWTFKLLDANRGANGHLKATSAEIVGVNANRLATTEAGVHRIQRIPSSESKGRIHTSTATVAVLPKPKTPTKATFDSTTLKVETKRSSGAGGQHVNTTDSAVRITHMPSGAVACSSQKSQHQNKMTALQTLRRKLAALALNKASAARAKLRTAQIGCASRTEKVRTYSFLRDKVIDHRLDVSLEGVIRFMDGDLSRLLWPS
ncbi:MAG: PCRF domain-containing protein [Candidatus Hodgkinia cicadicola]